MRFTSIDAPLTRDGDRVVYDGTPSGDLDLQVSFAPSLPIRIWRSLLHIGRMNGSARKVPDVEEQAPWGLF